MNMVGIGRCSIAVARCNEDRLRVNLFRLLENNMVLKALFDSLSEFTELDNNLWSQKASSVQADAAA